MLTANVSFPLESEALAVRPLPAPDRQKRFYCPKRKISHLEAWILRRALEGVSQIQERAREKEKKAAKINKFVRRSFNSELRLFATRVKRTKIAHLQRADILKGYFGYHPKSDASLGASGAPGTDWWRNVSTDPIPNQYYKGKKVGELSISLLEQAVRKWSPRVDWDRASESVRRTVRALLESWKHAHPELFYNRANASTCRALKRLRKRGFLEQGEDNRCIRLTSKGRRMARELSRF
jgi:hypothetical protein